MALSISTKNLLAGWFSGIGGGTTQYIGPGGYYSTGGFPPEAYEIPPSYLATPESSLAEIELVASVVGELPVDGARPVTEPNVSKIMASVGVSTLPPEQMIPSVPTFQTGSVLNPGLRLQPLPYDPDEFGEVLGAGLPIIAGLGLAASALPWIMRMMGIGGLVFGINLLDMFQYGRIFVYWEGKAIGSMEPEHAWVWYAELQGNQQRKVRMRMEGADKGGKNQRAPGYQGGSGDTQGSLPGESILEKINPLSPGSFWDRLIPWI